MNKNLVIGIIVGILVIAGIAFAYSTGDKDTNSTDNNTSTELTDSTAPATETDGTEPNGQTSNTDGSNSNQNNATPKDSDQKSSSEPPSNTSNVKTFNVSGSNFKFSPAEIKVKEGDTVRIVFKNEGGFHDWVLDEFSASTKQIQAGQTETIEFVANKKGTFEYYCSVGNHRAQGMVGKLIVE